MNDKYGSFDIRKQYLNKPDIIARGIQRVLNSLGLTISVKSKMVVDENNNERVSFEFLKE
jgi:hypothetical protein